MFLNRPFFFTNQLVILFMTFLIGVEGWAQTQTTPPTPPLVAKVATGSTIEAKPLWPELTEAQRTALAPLASEWRHIDTAGKQKWLAIAARFPAMKQPEQERAQARMKQWVSLTPEQRRQVRENYKAAKSIPKEQREAQWQQYQALPDERKKEIEAKAHSAQTRKPVGALPQSTAAKGSKPLVSTTPPPNPAITATPPSSSNTPASINTGIATPAK